MRTRRIKCTEHLYWGVITCHLLYRNSAPASAALTTGTHMVISPSSLYSLQLPARKSSASQSDIPPVGN